jgi:hypothetical protein
MNNDIKHIIDQTEQAAKLLCERDAIFDLNAKMTRKQYNALRKEDFGHDEAVLFTQALINK